MDNHLGWFTDDMIRLIEVLLLATISLILAFFTSLAVNISGREVNKLTDEMLAAVRQNKFSILLLSSIGLFVIYLLYSAISQGYFQQSSEQTETSKPGLELFPMLELLILGMAAVSYILLVFPFVLKKGFQILGVIVGTGNCREPISLKTPVIRTFPERIRKWLLIFTLIAFSSLLMPQITHLVFTLEKNPFFPGLARFHQQILIKEWHCYQE